MGRIGNYNLHLQEYFKALEKVDFRDCLDLKQQWQNYYMSVNASGYICDL